MALLVIRTAGDRDDERATAERLQHLARTHDLLRFVFTREVVIDAKAIPHSHPVLTLKAAYPDDDSLLAEFLHEQLHWFLSPRLDALKRAVGEFELMYPDLPVGLPEGAPTRWSSYLHLAVNALELRATQIFVGKQRARDILGGWRHYRGIYRIVLDETDRVEEVLKRHAIDIDHVDAQRL
jgi:hypothetical protein